MKTSFNTDLIWKIYMKFIKNIGVRDGVGGKFSLFQGHILEKCLGKLLNFPLKFLQNQIFFFQFWFPILISSPTPAPNQKFCVRIAIMKIFISKILNWIIFENIITWVRKLSCWQIYYQDNSKREVRKWHKILMSGRSRQIFLEKPIKI